MTMKWVLTDRPISKKNWRKFLRTGTFDGALDWGETGLLHEHSMDAVDPRIIEAARGVAQGTAE